MQAGVCVLIFLLPELFQMLVQEVVVFLVVENQFVVRALVRVTL
jgi:hypothetical protein